MYYCYVIYSQTLNKYYIGESDDVERRLELHNSGYFARAYSKRATDWSLFVVIPCPTRITALKIEKYLKKKKSRKYIERIKSNPEMINELISKIN